MVGSKHLGLRPRSWVEAIARFASRKLDKTRSFSLDADRAPQLKASVELRCEGSPWSALTCQRFVWRRPVAAGETLIKSRRQAATDQSGDRSPHSEGVVAYINEQDNKRLERTGISAFHRQLASETFVAPR